MDLSLIMTDEKYEEVFKGKHATPYFFDIKNGKGRALFYFGARHSRDPKDEQWQTLKIFWEKFLAESSTPRIVLLEGNPLPGKIPAGDEAIRQYGESSVVINLARELNIEIRWPEFDMTEESQILVKQFDSELVYYFYFVRSASAWIRAGNVGGFDEVINKAADATARRIPGAPTSLSSYEATHQKLFGRPLNQNEIKTMQRAIAPVFHDSIINDIARASSQLRNERIVLEAERYWNSGYSIFMLFGAAHAVVQEAALKTLGN